MAVQTGDPAQEVSEGRLTMDKKLLLRYSGCGMWLLSDYPKNLPEANLKSIGRISLVEKISQ